MNRIGRKTAVIGVLLFLVVGVFFIQHSVFAAPLDAVGVGAGLPQQSLPILIAKIIRAVLGVLGIIIVIFFIYAGWIYMSAQGDPEKVKKAKKIISNAIIGLTITLFSYSIASWILDKLLEAAYGNGTIVSVAKKYTEPLAGSLGAGIIESHYPTRNASSIPRNTKIFVTFKEPIKPETIIDGYVADCVYTTPLPAGKVACATKLNTNAVEVFETAKGATNKLAADKVTVTVSSDKKTFVFKPVVYLGNANKDTNYSVALKPSIQKADGNAAFTGVNSAGYAWNFTVSTNIDLTSPKVLSVIPAKDQIYAKNITVEVTFNEAMDPIATTGTYELNGGDQKNFQNIVVGDGTKDSDNNLIPVTNGSFDISNGYRSVDFTTTDACGKDPCGGMMYCLPGGKSITVDVKAASVDDSNPPQGILTGVHYNGVVDAAGNSLDGNDDGKACGSSKDNVICSGTQTNDDYTWGFSTSDVIDDTVPKIDSLAPKILEGSINVSDDVTLTFNTLLKASTVNSTNVSLWPDPKYPMWFIPNKEDLHDGRTVVSISHPPFISNVEGGSSYWPVVTQEVKSAYQICMFPAMGADTLTDVNGKPVTCKNNDQQPYCCNGQPQAGECPIPKPK